MKLAFERLSVYDNYWNTKKKRKYVPWTLLIIIININTEHYIYANIFYIFLLETNFYFIIPQYFLFYFYFLITEYSYFYNVYNVLYTIMHKKTSQDRLLYFIWNKYFILTIKSPITVNNSKPNTKKKKLLIK